MTRIMTELGVLDLCDKLIVLMAEGHAAVQKYQPPPYLDPVFSSGQVQGMDGTNVFPTEKK